MKILLVEDEFLIAALLKRELQLEGYRVCDLVGTGEEAIERAETEQPDLILMDIRLGGHLTGIEAAREIQRRFQTPIIFMSGYSDQKMISEAKDVTPLAYLVKPITPDDIKPVIEAAFKRGD